MKRVFIIAAALIAALPMAHATTYLFTSGTAGSSENVTVGGYKITVWGYDLTSQSGSGSNISLNGGASALSYDSFGLGVANTSNEVTLNSFVVVDFSDPASPGPEGPKLAGATTATIDIDNADSGWIIYGGNTAPGAGGIGSLTQITSGSGNVASEVVSITNYSYLAIVAAQTCELNIYSIIANTPGTVPEPGTFLMAGMALIGLGAALRKTCKT
jgi:hypothetical protein